MLTILREARRKMSIDELRNVLYDITARFFVGATVIWAEQTNTKPPFPYVTLKLGAVQRNAFPLLTENARYYECRTTVEINLYTKGRPINVKGDAVTGNFVNTATADMMDFFNYLESEQITDLLAGYGMDISLMPPVRDLTELLNDSRYRYRSMAEASVSFALEADGMYGIGSMPAVPNPSGGGTQSMAETEYEPIEEVEITEEETHEK